MICLIVGAFAVPLFAASRARAQPRIDEEVLRSVVILTSPSERTCATGFITSSGELITNAHVSASLCPHGRCRDVRIFRATSLGGPGSIGLPHDGVTVSREFAAFDIAVLEAAWKNPDQRRSAPGVFKLSAFSGSRSAAVYSLGFPRCQALELTQGRIERENMITLQTSTLGSHGSSGSPVFLEDFSVVGVVNQSSSVLQAVSSLIFGTHFKNRAVKADLIRNALNFDEQAALTYQAGTLLRLYRDETAVRRGFARMMDGYNFLATVESLRRQVLAQPAFTAVGLHTPFAGLGEYPPFSLSRVPPELSRVDPGVAMLLQEIVVVYNLELHGPYRALLKPITPDELEVFLQTLAVPKEVTLDLRQLFRYAQESGFRGLELQTIMLATLALAAFFALLIVWAFSMGHVFTAAGGTRMTRLGKSLLVGLVLWPLSLAVFHMLPRRSAGK